MKVVCLIEIIICVFILCICSNVKWNDIGMIVVWIICLLICEFIDDLFCIYVYIMI